MGRLEVYIAHKTLTGALHYSILSFNPSIHLIAIKPISSFTNSCKLAHSWPLLRCRCEIVSKGWQPRCWASLRSLDLLQIPLKVRNPLDCLKIGAKPGVHSLQRLICPQLPTNSLRIQRCIEAILRQNPQLEILELHYYLSNSLLEQTLPHFGKQLTHLAINQNAEALTIETIQRIVRYAPGLRYLGFVLTTIPENSLEYIRELPHLHTLLLPATIRPSPSHRSSAFRANSSHFTAHGSFKLLNDHKSLKYLASSNITLADHFYSVAAVKSIAPTPVGVNLYFLINRFNCNSPLSAAIRAGNIPLMEDLLDNKAELHHNILLTPVEMPINVVIESGFGLTTFRALINHGANLLQRVGADNNTILALTLQHVIRKSSLLPLFSQFVDYILDTAIPKIFETAKVPLTQETMTEALTVYQAGERMPLLLSTPNINASMLMRLLHCKHLHLDPKATNDSGRTALHVLSQYTAIEALLKVGVDLFAKDAWGHTPLCTHAALKHHEIVRLLVQKMKDERPNERLVLTPETIMSLINVGSVASVHHYMSDEDLEGCGHDLVRLLATGPFRLYDPNAPMVSSGIQFLFSRHSNPWKAEVVAKINKALLQSHLDSLAAEETPLICLIAGTTHARPDLTILLINALGQASKNDLSISNRVLTAQDRSNLSAVDHALTKFAKTARGTWLEIVATFIVNGVAQKYFTDRRASLIEPWLAPINSPIFQAVGAFFETGEISQELRDFATSVYNQSQRSVTCYCVAK